MDTTHLFSLQGKTALITGGSRGIGAEIAKQLSAEGARIFIAANDSDDMFENVVRECRAQIVRDQVRDRGTRAAHPPFAVRVAKSFVNAGGADRALADSVEATALLFSTDDHRQAVARFLERPRRDRA